MHRPPIFAYIQKRVTVMKCISTYVVCSVLGLCSLQAQTMTLKECIVQGLANNLTVGNARTDMAKGRTALSQSRAKLLPVIDGRFQLTGYLKSPVNVTTGVLMGNDFPDTPTWQTIKSMPLNAGAGVLLSMPIYNQTILAGIEVTKTLEKIKSLSYEKAAEDLIMQIGKVYCLAQTSQEHTELLDKNIARMSDLCEITDALYSQGVVLEVDLNRVRINLQNLKAQRDEYHTLHEQHLHMLRFLLDMDTDAPLAVTHMSEGIEPVQASGLSTSLPELLLAERQEEIIGQQIKVARSGYIPTLSFTGYAGALGYQEKLRHFLHGNTATDNWFGNCYVAFSLRVPLFEANSKRLQVKQLRYDGQMAANRVEQQRKQLAKNYADACLQLSHSAETYLVQADSYRQAKSVYDITEEQYKEGVASMTALLQDEMRLRTAQAACVQAHCQYDLARLDLLKLSGNLSQLSQ